MLSGRNLRESIGASDIQVIFTRIVEAVDGNRDRFIYEASDMVYHLLVLLEQMGCSLEDLEKELQLRHK
jgi:phosphoribosyl-ATP pyrophosphohydrolase